MDMKEITSFKNKIFKNKENIYVFITSEKQTIKTEFFTVEAFSCYVLNALKKSDFKTTPDANMTVEYLMKEFEFVKELEENISPEEFSEKIKNLEALKVFQ